MLHASRDYFKSIKLLVNAIFLITLASMVFIYPFDSPFRFTLGIAVLSTLLLYFEQLPVIPTALLSGIMIVVLRTAIYFSLGNYDLQEAILRNFPAFFYYLSYGISFHALRLREHVTNVPILILALSITDVISNLVEILIRAELTGKNFEVIFASIIAVAIFRTVVAVYGYYTLKKYHAFVLAEDQLLRYAKLTVMIAKLRAELFYLKKSSQDIEIIMEKSYWLYNHLHVKETDESHPEKSSAIQALTIARSIHEVKKDYSRVITGIENIIKPSTVGEGMLLSEIFFIIEQNTTRYLSILDKKIHITFEFTDDFITNKHYTIVSILDNLITNAIEACSDEGKIRITQTITNHSVVFQIEDNGSGISSTDFDIIFKPGYSTKFSPHTGKMSTGLGLVHVKNLASALGGAISVTSQPNISTVFTVAIPAHQLVTQPIGDNN
jgi:two-component system, sensor histidine kinase YcbA